MAGPASLEHQKLPVDVSVSKVRAAKAQVHPDLTLQPYGATLDQASDPHQQRLPENLDRTGNQSCCLLLSSLMEMLV